MHYIHSKKEKLKGGEILLSRWFMDGTKGSLYEEPLALVQLFSVSHEYGIWTVDGCFIREPLYNDVRTHFLCISSIEADIAFYQWNMSDELVATVPNQIDTSGLFFTLKILAIGAPCLRSLYSTIL